MSTTYPEPTYPKPCHCSGKLNLRRLGVEASGPFTAAPGGVQLQQLRDRLQRVSAELGVAMEAQLRETLRLLSGREIPGEARGVDRSVAIPAFSRVEGYLSPDGRTEIDTLARDGENWAVEVRWQVGAATEEDVRRFLAKQADVQIHRRWFISRGGFRPRAVDLARANSLYLTDGAGYHHLRVLGRQG